MSADPRARRYMYRGGTMSRVDAGAATKAALDNLSVITKVVGEFYGFEPTVLLGRVETHNLALPRHVLMLLMYDSSPFVSLNDIGRIMGKRHHTSIIHGLQKIREWAKKEKDIAADIAELRETLKLEERPS